MKKWRTTLFALMLALVAIPALASAANASPAAHHHRRHHHGRRK